MTKNTEMEYYLYTHTRLDTGDIFYVGIGTKCKKCNRKFFKQEYHRAFSKSRNFLWKRIVDKTEYKVDIIQEFNNLSECLKEESFLIQKYGRIINNTGNLSNLIVSDEEREELRIKNLLLSIEKRKIKAFKYSLEGRYIEEYESISEAALKNNMRSSDIALCMKEKIPTAGKFIWRNFKTDKILSRKEIIDNNKINILQYDLHNRFIKRWNSISSAAKAMKVCSSAIRNVLCGISYSCNNYKWVYKEEDLTLPLIPCLKVFDLNMNFINEFYSLTSAEKELGLPFNSISVYLRRNKPHYKYIFQKIKK